MKKLTKEHIKSELIEVIASDLERCAPSYSECAYLAETIIQRFITLESLGEEEVEKTMTQSEFEGFRSMYNAMVEENRLLKADLIREKKILLKIRNNVRIWEDTNPDINVQEFKPIKLKPLKNPE